MDLQNYDQGSLSKEFLVKDLDSGEVFDIRLPHETKKLQSKIHNYNHLNEDQINFIVENLKIKEKINTKFFKACEKADLEKITELLDRKTSRDRKPNINEKYLHDYTVLHVAVTNGRQYINN